MGSQPRCWGSPARRSQGCCVVGLQDGYCRTPFNVLNPSLLNPGGLRDDCAVSHQVLQPIVTVSSTHAVGSENGEAILQTHSPFSS